MHGPERNEPSPEPKFESALALWITMWQRQLVYGGTA
jgi:hypothetical protein